MIDKKSGTLTIGQDIQFGPQVAFKILKDLKLGESAEIIGSIDAIEQKLKFNNVKVENNYYIFRLSFELNRLFMLEIFISPGPFMFKKSWTHWSYEDELKHLEYCTAWLQHEVGATRNFTWGHIWCGYDSLGGYSSIKIRYV
ncbi:hypothetical protein [Allomuricauda sp.]|uniref:hypothetical protein n=1 Tax=Flagellimonas alginolytica TaxID=3177515 RepID=UPI0025FEE1B1|nr:hypothetical protein [Allomuricauda sp.]